MTLEQINWRNAMKRKRFSEEQIIRILKEFETIRNVREVCILHNVTEQSFFQDPLMIDFCEERPYKDRFETGN